MQYTKFAMTLAMGACQWQDLFNFLILPEHQAPHLNTLPCRRPLILSLNLKRTMRTPPCPPIHLRVEALDHQHLIGHHTTRIVPLVLGAVQDIPDLEPFALRHNTKRTLALLR